MRNFNYLFLLSLFFLSSCEIEEVDRQPLLASPLGLAVKIAPAIDDGSGPRNGFALFFTANNPEIYFSGFSVYISTRKEDFESFPVGENFFPINPTQVESNQARLLTNYSPVHDTNVSIWIGGKMSFPERRIYPPNAQIDPASEFPMSDPDFNLTSFSTLPPDATGAGGGNFVSGTTYYFAAYSYSSIDGEYSLPSNIVSIIFP